MKEINPRDAGSELRETKLYNAMIEARENGDEEKAQMYFDVLEKSRTGQQLDPVTMRMLALTNPELFAEIMRSQMRRGQQANTGSSAADPPAAGSPVDLKKFIDGFNLNQ